MQTDTKNVFLIFIIVIIGAYENRERVFLRQT